MSKFDGEILGRLADATPDEITAALAAIRAEANSFAGQTPTSDIVSRSAELADAARKLHAEQGRRAQEAKDFGDNLAALEELTAPAEQSGQPEPAGEQPGESPRIERAPSPQPDEQPKPDTGDGAKPDDGDQGDGDNRPANDNDDAGDETVTAAGRRRLGSHNSGTGAGGRTLERVSYRTTAATGLREAAPGEDLDRDTLLTAFHSKINAVQGTRLSGARPERFEVATVRADFPESRQLGRSDNAFTTMDKISAAVKAAQEPLPQGLTAAGLCAPLENLYDIEVVGDDDRPVRDALVRFGVERGGIQYRPSFDGVTQNVGIGVWTTDNDEADPLVPKVCAEIDCPGLVDATVDAIYQCLTFSNFSTRFDPEWMAATIRAQRVYHARFAENRLLTALTTASKTVYSTQLLGATRDALWTLDHMVAYYRNVHRLRNEAPLRMIAPLWMLNMLRADITYQMVGDGLQSMAVTDAEINAWFAARNVRITWHLDGINPADITETDPDIVVPAQFYTTLTTGSAVPGFPDAVSTLLFREGDWLHLDGGTLDLGTVRDSTLNGLNRFQTFSENWEGLAFRGIESFQLVLRLNPTGQSAATKDTSSAS